MRVKVISRSTDDFTRERSQDLQKVFRNYDPELRTQEKAVEYTRALNAAKLEKIFAKPFIGAMDGHIDVVSCMTRCNSICWNPREPMNLTAANEDTNCYSFDTSKLDEAKIVHKGHVSAVMDVDYSPTGREFITGSYDRTVRNFQYNGDHSRAIYHTKRMQRVFCVKYTYDGTYLVSGNDDTNLRLWKSKASEQLGIWGSRRCRVVVLAPCSRTEDVAFEDEGLNGSPCASSLGSEV